MDCFASLAMTVLGLPSLKMNQKLIFDGAELRFRRLRPKASAPQSNPPLMRLCICQAQKLRPDWFEAPHHIPQRQLQPESIIS
jgi:hypothetical protein